MENFNNEPLNIQNEKESIESFLDEAIQQSPIIGSGRDGVVLKVNIKNLSKQSNEAIKSINQEEAEVNNLAIKILKIYRPGAGSIEFDFQKKAYEILKREVNCAKVPKPILLHTKHLSESDLLFLKNQNHALEEDAEIILMDFVNGKDLATYIYDFILSSNGYDNESILNMSFLQKQSFISTILNFEQPQNNLDDFKNIISERDNLRKMINYLRKRKFVINEEVLTKIERTVEVLESNFIFHNDLHERNIMIDENGEVFIIDFGRSVNNKADQEKDDQDIVRRYRNIDSQDEGLLENDFIKDVITSQEKNKDIIENSKKWLIYIEQNNYIPIIRSIISNSAVESYLKKDLSKIVYIFNNSNQETRTRVIAILNELKTSINKEFVNRNIQNLLNYLNKNNTA
jgi:hypothetical protein